VSVDLTTAGRLAGRVWWRWRGWTRERRRTREPRVEVDVLVQVDDPVAHASRIPGNLHRPRRHPPPIVLRIQLRHRRIGEGIDVHSGERVSLNAVLVSRDIGVRGDTETDEGILDDDRAVPVEQRVTDDHHPRIASEEVDGAAARRAGADITADRAVADAEERYALGRWGHELVVGNGHVGGDGADGGPEHQHGAAAVAAELVLVYRGLTQSQIRVDTVSGCRAWDSVVPNRVELDESRKRTGVVEVD